jgi:hypothetical protein
MITADVDKTALQISIAKPNILIGERKEEIIAE